MRRETLTFAEVAKLYGTGVKRVRDAVARGELPSTELCGKVFVLRRPIEARLRETIVLDDERIAVNGAALSAEPHDLDTA